MALRDPVAVYNAAHNMEAVLVRNALTAAGVEAFITEDLSVVGGWWGGLIPEIHKPQVWVDQTDVLRAKPVLEEYERRGAALRGITDPNEVQIEAVCEKCGGYASFPSSQAGSVQSCPHCRAYMDVGGDEPEKA